MNSRERVTASLKFANPDRTPRDLWSALYTIMFQKKEYEDLLQEWPMDINFSQPYPGMDKINESRYRKKGSYIDEWGSIWNIAEPGIVGEVKKPVLNDWSELKSFIPPYEIIKDRDKSFIDNVCEKSGKFMISDVTARPFERLQFLRGSEDLFMDIAYDRPELHKLIKIIHEFYLEDISFWCNTDVDAIFFMDDMGTNISTLISPGSWRNLFKPLYKEYCELIHSANKFAFFHSDGNTSSIFSDFIEIGIDAVNSQLFVMNIEKLAEKYKGKITFWGEIDRQKVLPFGLPEDVESAVLRVRTALDDGSGGVIAQCEWGKNDPVENIKSVYEAWN